MWGCVVLAISGTGCSDHLLWLWDVEGPTGATIQLGYGEFWGLGRFDGFEYQGDWSL